MLTHERVRWFIAMRFATVRRSPPSSPALLSKFRYRADVGLYPAPLYPRRPNHVRYLPGSARHASLALYQAYDPFGACLSAYCPWHSVAGSQFPAHCRMSLSCATS